MHTPTPTPEAVHLAEALWKREVNAKMECPDGHKSVDICIPDARLYIEVNGMHHYTNPEQIKTDFSRDHFSDDDGFSTFRVPNKILETHLEEIANAIQKIVQERIPR